MSRELAKSPYLRAVNDPEKGYIVPADAQQSIDVIYDDMEQADQDTLRLSSGGIVSGPIDIRGGLYIRSGSPNAGYVLASDANGGTYWTQSQAGPKGDQGDQGPVGPQGMTGPQGPPGQQGATGSTGAQGPKGDKGDTGDTGPQGVTGPQGIQGVKGDTGNTGPIGATGPAGPTGATGTPGAGVIPGGTTGQVLAKASATDYDTEWIAAPSGVGANGVNTAAIQDSAVTSDKIADGSIMGTDINSAANIATTQIAGTAVVHSLIDAKGDLLVGTGNDAVGRLPVGGTNGHALVVDSGQPTGVKWAAVAGSQSVNAQTGTTYTPALSDAGNIVTLSNTAGITVTLPQDSAVAFPIGSRIDFVVLNTGMATFSAGAGATVNATPSVVTRARWSTAWAVKVAANTWVVQGDLAEFPLTTGKYGPAINMDSLANETVGGPSNMMVSFRFRAEQSSTLTAYRVYWLDETVGGGYGGGTGGTFRVSIKADSGGVPSGPDLAYTDVAPTDTFPLHTFSAPASLTAGAVYHLVFTNTDGAPATNWSSVDCVYTMRSFSPRQPRWDDTDNAVLYKIPAGSWTVDPDFTPIMDLTYGNGLHQGQGYMETEDTSLSIAGTTDMVRERFTVSGGDRAVTGATVRLAKTSGTGDLTVRLEDNTGTLIDSFTVPASSIPTVTGWDNGAWVSGTFAQSRILTSGQEYRLRLSAPAGTAFFTRGIQQGGGNGFHPATYFSDGVLEVTTNSGSTWGYVTGLGDMGDLQFYFV